MRKKLLICSLLIFFACHETKENPSEVWIGGTVPTFTDVKELTITNKKLSSLGGIDDLKQLVSLTIVASVIEDYSALRYARNLKNLTMSGVWTVGDITVLSNLKKLTYLNLDDTDVSNIGPLSKLNQLKFLALNNTKVIDFTPIKNSNLEKLTIIGIDPGDGSSLPRNLKKLRISAKYSYRVNSIYKLFPNCKIIID